jgi:hypothetical protein
MMGQEAVHSFMYIGELLGGPIKCDGEEVNARIAILMAFGKPIRQRFIHRSAVTHGHEADDSSLVIDCVDDTKAVNAIFSQPIDFPFERLSTFRIRGNALLETQPNSQGAVECGLISSSEATKTPIDACFVQGKQSAFDCAWKQEAGACPISQGKFTQL